MKTSITFALVILHAGASPLWTMQISGGWSDLLAETLVRRRGVDFVWKSAGHLHKAGFEGNLYLRAFEQGALDTALGKRRGWYMQKTGGMTPSVCEVIETRVVEVDTGSMGGACEATEDASTALLRAWPTDAPPPPEGVRFSQWPGGKHWYARMADGTDVEVAGKSKWDTLEEAHVAARLVEEARKRLTESEATLAAALDGGSASPNPKSKP